MNVCSNPGENMDSSSSGHIGSSSFDCRMENPRSNPFFAGVFDSPNGSALSLSVVNGANSEGNVTPTTLQVRFYAKLRFVYPLNLRFATSL